MLITQTALIFQLGCHARCERVVRNGSRPRQGSPGSGMPQCGPTLARIVRIWCGIRSARAAPLCGSRTALARGDGGGAVRGGVESEKKKTKKQQQKRPELKAGDGNGDSQQQKKGEFGKVVEREKPVIMAAGAKVAKRIPLIKFPNRKAGETQGAHAVNRASGGGVQSQAMPSLPSGTASSQPPRTKLSEAEIEAILLGGAAP